MNIFVLDEDPVAAAAMHCDRHVVKMIVEYAQLLSTAHRLLDPDVPEDVCYRVTHANHPCGIWTRATAGNYRWLFTLFDACLDEYTHRYGKVHATGRHRDFLNNPPRSIPDGPRTEFAQTMPDPYRRPGDAVGAYRALYCGDKARFCTWKKREKPDWFAPTNL